MDTTTGDHLVAACHLGDLDEVHQLLADGSSPCSYDQHGVTATIAAASSGNAQIVQALLASDTKADLMAETKAGDFALRAACLIGDADCVCALLDANTDVNQETNRGSALLAATLQVLLTLVACRSNNLRDLLRRLWFLRFFAEL